ncbi:MAG TPA: glycosyltransferase [Candidatus Aquicultoraceae bacterium]|nr:glycosyltransferase [Candidatus Aquicultoraceae bacterium]
MNEDRKSSIRRATARRKIVVAYLLPNLEAGGTENHLLSLVQRIDRNRFLPSLFTTAGGGSLYGAFAQLLPVTVFGDPSHARRIRTGPIEQLRTTWRIAAILRKDRPDILHAYLPAANVIGPIAARIAGVPTVIVSKRALANYKKRFPLLRQLEPLGNRLADVILVNSDAVRRDVERTERAWEGKFRKIYNGVAPIAEWTEEERRAFRAREGIPSDARVVLSVSNFFPYKGHEELIEAAGQVVDAIPHVLFLLAGRDSGTLEKCKRLAKERLPAHAVRFLGSRTDVPDLLRASDLFVHPSHEEGFSNAILEAMAAGLPVVACNVGGNPEAIVHGKTGLLVPPRDPEVLAAAIREIAGAPDWGRPYGEAGRRRAAEDFSLDRMIAEIEAMYASPAGCGGGPR